MRYIEIKNNKIIGHYADDELPPKKEGIKYIVLDENAYPIIGDDVAFYKDLKTAEKKPLKQLIDEGLKTIPEGKKLNKKQTDFVDMTEAEKWEAGMIVLEPTQWLDDGSDYIREKTIQEKYAAGLISKTEYNKNIKLQRETAYRQEADKLFFHFMRGEIQKEVWLQKIEEIKNRFPKL